MTSELILDVMYSGLKFHKSWKFTAPVSSCRCDGTVFSDVIPMVRSECQEIPDVNNKILGCLYQWGKLVVCVNINLINKYLFFNKILFCDQHLINEWWLCLDY